jgi:hypothetical protein
LDLDGVVADFQGGIWAGLERDAGAAVIANNQNTENADGIPATKTSKKAELPPHAIKEVIALTDGFYHSLNWLPRGANAEKDFDFLSARTFRFPPQKNAKSNGTKNAHSNDISASPGGRSLSAFVLQYCLVNDIHLEVLTAVGRDFCVANAKDKRRWVVGMNILTAKR